MAGGGCHSLGCAVLGGGTPGPTPGHRPREDHNSERHVQYTPVFVAAQFTIARTWKQPKCPSAEEQIKKMWCVHCVCVCVFVYICLYVYTHTQWNIT